MAFHQIRSPLLLVALSLHVIIPNYMLKFEKSESVDTESNHQHFFDPRNLRRNSDVQKMNREGEKDD